MLFFFLWKLIFKIYGNQNFQQKQTFDPQRLIEMKEREQELLNEMKEHRNQYARIEEALRSTGKLHNELQQQKDELRFKIIVR